MTNTYHIHVTKKDIKSGKRSSPRLDPIALAIRRATGEIVFVGSSFIEIGDNWPEVKGKVAEFIKRFDEGKKVKPFNFDLVVEE